jgi:hypothetical protein
MVESDSTLISPPYELDPNLRQSESRDASFSDRGGVGQYAKSPVSSESGRSKIERREMLRQEAERMREALKAKERELAELGLTD